MTVKRERRENPNSEAIKFLDKLEGKEKAASLPNDSQTKSDTSKSIKPHAQMLPASPKGLEIEKLSVLRSDLYKKNFMPVTLVQHSSAVKKPLLVRRLG